MATPGDFSQAQLDAAAQAMGYIDANDFHTNGGDVGILQSFIEGQTPTTPTAAQQAAGAAYTILNGPGQWNDPSKSVASITQQLIQQGYAPDVAQQAATAQDQSYLTNLNTAGTQEAHAQAAANNNSGIWSILPPAAFAAFSALSGNVLGPLVGSAMDTGSPLLDSALTKAGTGAITSAATGQNPVMGAISGGVSGATGNLFGGLFTQAGAPVVDATMTPVDSGGMMGVVSDTGSAASPTFDAAAAAFTPPADTGGVMGVTPQSAFQAPVSTANAFGPTTATDPTTGLPQAAGLAQTPSPNITNAIGAGAATGATNMSGFFDPNAIANAFGAGSGIDTSLGSGLSLDGTGMFGTSVLDQSIPNINQLTGVATGSLDQFGNPTNLIPGVNSVYDFSTGQYVPAVSDASGNLVAADSLNTGGGISGNTSGSLMNQIQSALGSAGSGLSGLTNALGMTGQANGGSTVPGLMALAYASQQPNINTSQLSQVMSGYSGLTPQASGMSSALQNAQGLNTNALQNLVGQNVSTQGILNAGGQQINTGALQGVLGQAQQGANTGNLQSVYDQLGANTPGFVNAAIAPFQQNLASGYGDMLQSQAKRGISGSSFGNNDIGNFLSTGGQALSNAGAQAYQSSLMNQGNVANQMLGAQQQNLAQQGTLANQLAGYSQQDIANMLAAQNSAANVGLSNQSNQTQLAQLLGSQANANVGLQGQIANQIGNQGLQSQQQQGSLAYQIAQLQNQSQLQKNNMYGQAFNILGRGMNPQGYIGAALPAGQ